MFKRRTPRTPWQKLRNFVYPYMGWKRALKYWHYRTVRLPGTATGIAKGFACGAAISFTPFLFFHLALSMALAWVMGGSLVACAIGTLVGNPFTFIAIFPLIYKTGKFILGMNSGIDRHNEIFSLSEGSSIADIWHKAELLFDPVLLPMIVGSIPCGILAWFISYKLCYRVVKQHHTRRHDRKNARRKHLSPHAAMVSSNAVTAISPEREES